MSAAPPTHAPRCDQAPSWTALRGHYEAHGRGLDLRQAFTQDPQRAARFGFEAAGIGADLSRQRIDWAGWQLLLALGRECALPQRLAAQLAGAPVNATEGRAVLHTALRAPRGAAPYAGDVHATLDAFLAFADGLRADVEAGRSPIRHVVHIGIGGSDLGPQLVTQALAPFTHEQIRSHFVSNVDGANLMRVLRHLRPQETLFIVASKTFTTQETLANAQAARAWFLAGGGTEAGIPDHFVGISTNVPAVQAFGIRTVFGFWDWVGGRFSLWSAIGLPVAIAIGGERFRALLAGAHAMDRHAATAPLESNLPLLLGLLDVWNRNFHGYASRAVVPYADGLRRLPAYLQQLEMESNGKCVDIEGEPLALSTSPVVWGEAGTNGQHAFFQMLHQGTDVVPVEFILVKQETFAASLPLPLRERLQEQHAMLLANGLAQAQALMHGKTTDEALRETAPTASPHADALTIAKHRSFPGNRPSTTLLLDELTPQALGALIALYEHRVFAAGALWGINSYDQWGVELGKALAKDLLPRLASGDVAGLDGSTAALVQRLRRP
jgi:glucose-6-phosphate isomerase